MIEYHVSRIANSEYDTIESDKQPLTRKHYRNRSNMMGSPDSEEHNFKFFRRSKKVDAEC
jgi:hypothetical protein